MNRFKILYIILLILICLSILSLIGLKIKLDSDYKENINNLSREYESIKDTIDIGDKFIIEGDKPDLSDNSNSEDKNNTSNDTDKEDNKNTEDVNDNSEANTVNDFNNYDEFINEITTIVNNKDYNKLLTYFDDTYIEEFGITADELKRRFIFEHEVSPKVMNIDKYGDITVIAVRLIDEFNSERMYHFTIFENGKIADIGMEAALDVSYLKEHYEVTFKTIKKYLMMNGNAYLVEISNNSEELVDIVNIYGVRSEHKFIGEILHPMYKDLLVYPKETIRVPILIPNTDTIDNIIFRWNRYSGEEDLAIWEKDKF